MMRPVVRLFITASSALLLAGCWQSNAPLVPEGEVDKVKLAKFYETVETGTTKSTRYRMEKDGKRWKAFKQHSDGKSESEFRITFDKLVGKFYLAQMMDDTDQKVDAYRIFDLSKKGQMIVWEPTCNADESTVPSVERDGNTCRFYEYASLKKRAMARAEQLRNGDKAGGTPDKTYKAAKK